jgi:peptidoglycan/LPS O-acetylase OafA/YrhL
MDMIENSSEENTSNSAPNYIPVITLLRGIASVMVCIFHLIWKPLNFLENTSLWEQAQYGKYGVQIFFVITGVVIPLGLINGKYNYSLFGRFILKRMVRIEPPYLFSILTGILFILLRNHFLSKAPHELPSARSLLLHLGYLVPFVKGEQWFMDVYWTMAIEFQFYLLISLLLPLLISTNRAKRLISYSIAFGIAIIFRNKELVMVWLPVFMIGLIYISYRCRKVSATELWLILATATCFNLMLHGYIVTLVSISTLGVIHFFSNYQSRISNFFGSISYSLYLTHMVFGAATVNFFIPYISSFQLKLAVILLAFLVSILSAYIFYLLVERPCQKSASAIALQRKSKEPKKSFDDFILN